MKVIYDHVITFIKVVLKTAGFLVFALIMYPSMWLYQKYKNGKKSKKT